MNYRHAFHAGNFADVLKHAVLVDIIAYLQRKPGPLRVIETHAGAGLYDLLSEEAARTSEWKQGVARLDVPFDSETEAFLAPYRALLTSLRTRHGAGSYPGSPLIAQALLRTDDVYVGAELHPKVFAALEEALGRDRRCKALPIDAWHALRAQVPPPERRGLVLIDPAFEAADEWSVLARETAAAIRKWPTGCFMIWYPLKNPRQADDLNDALAAVSASLLRLELAVDDLAAAQKLAGCGLLIVNAPWTLAPQMQHVLPALAERFARSDRAGFRCENKAR